MRWHDPIWLWTDASHITHVSSDNPGGYGYLIRWNASEFYMGAGPLAASKHTHLLELQSVLCGIRALNNVIIRKGGSERLILVHNDNTDVTRIVSRNRVIDESEVAHELNRYVRTFAYRIGFVYHRKHYYKANKEHNLVHDFAYEAAKQGLHFSEKVDRIPKHPREWLWRKYGGTKAR